MSSVWRGALVEQISPGCHPHVPWASSDITVEIVLMTTLPEIEAAAAALSSEQQQELFLFLAARLRAGSTQLPSPRDFIRPQIDAWIADDEEGMRRFQAG
jgi:hypothetical protein